MLSEEQVRHVAKLARIELTDDEVERFGAQMSKVLGYVEKLSEVNTDGVVPTSQVTGLSSVMGEDRLRDGAECSREELLGCSELPVENNQIKVKKTI